MALETGTYLSDLVSSNPAHTDGLNQADSHIRLIKSVLKATFPNLNGAVSLTPAQLNALATALVANTDGTSGAPSINFLSEASLGFYRVGAGEIGIAGRLIGQGTVPIGTVIDHAGTTAPTGYMVCDGQALSTTTYPELFAAIGYTWGGSGTTFNLPNLISRFRRHRDNSTLAGVVGTLQAPANMAHTHGVSGTTSIESVSHSHAFSGTTGSMNANASHSHVEQFPQPGGGATWNESVNGTTTGTLTSSFGSGVNISTLATNTDHQHTFSGTTGTESVNHAHTFNVTSAGGSADNANEARPYSATVLACIRVL